jgi:transposase-like protein
MGRKTSLNAPHFHDDNKAREYLESIRWPNGPVCPHCGTVSANHYRLEGKGGDKGQKARPGLLKCCEKACRKQFSVTVGTVFERSHIPLSKWLMAAHLLCCSKKGISSHQLMRTLGVTYKTAWFLSHRIRHAVASPVPTVMGAEGGIVEADETYFGNKYTGSKKPQRWQRAGHGHKHTVFALVERGGPMRSFHIRKDTFKGIQKALKVVSPDAHVMTDSHRMYTNIMRPFASHEIVNHSKGEYVRGEAHTNTIEGAFSVFKRGMIGTYQHCGEQHLHRYLSEFDFRYNTRAALKIDDQERTRRVLAAIAGKRLIYKQPIGKLIEQDKEP